MHALILNLKRRPDRRTQFLDWNGHHDIAFEFVEAVDGQTLSRQCLRDQGLITDDTDRWTVGALGNALSHRRLWIRAVETGEPQWVFEDDACLRGDFSTRLPQILEGLDDPDFLYLGFNTNASLCVEGPEGLISVVLFDESCKRSPDYFRRYSRLCSARPPNVLRCLQAWGHPAYMVTPRGAKRLLERCFPLRSSPPLPLLGQNRQISPYTLDGLINLALLRQGIESRCCFPPLVLTPNDYHGSDVVTLP